MEQIELNEDQKQQQSWLLSKAGVLITLFVVAGFLGLPLLYKSNAFTKKGKILLTILVLIYTVVIILLTVAIIIWLVGVLRGALNV